MKTLMMIPAMLMFLGTTQAQDRTTPPAKEKPAATSTTTGTVELLKEHTCTAACVDGKHMYAHGEKGHACTEECMKMHHAAATGHEGHGHGEMKEAKEEVKAASGEAKEEIMEQKGEMKTHVCTAACKDGKHAYMHGEKGHTCDATCAHMRERKK
ncbi:MAG: hypothetical protein IPP83_10605 [Flavobacteriales bacterium]|nr:hypothetical protein [Flavobacteriales bacterium]